MPQPWEKYSSTSTTTTQTPSSEKPWEKYASESTSTSKTTNDGPDFLDKLTATNITPPSDIKNIKNPVLRNLTNFGSEFGGAILSPIGAVRHPLDTFSSLSGNNLADQARSEEAEHPVWSKIHAFESGVPVLGPLAASLDSQVRAGNYSGALGSLAGSAAPLLAGDAASDAAKPVTKAVINKTGSVLAHPATGPIVGTGVGLASGLAHGLGVDIVPHGVSGYLGYKLGDLAKPMLKKAGTAMRYTTESQVPDIGRLLTAMHSVTTPVDQQNVPKKDK